MTKLDATRGRKGEPKVWISVNLFLLNLASISWAHPWRFDTRALQSASTSKQQFPTCHTLHNGGGWHNPEKILHVQYCDGVTSLENSKTVRKHKCLKQLSKENGKWHFKIIISRSFKVTATLGSTNNVFLFFVRVAAESERPISFTESISVLISSKYAWRQRSASRRLRHTAIITQRFVYI